MNDPRVRLLRRLQAAGRETPRRRALCVLLDAAGQGSVAAALDRAQRERPLAPADAALAFELALGVVRHRLTLDTLSRTFFRGRWTHLAPSLRAILAMAVYQLCWLERVPAFAAVDQAVDLAKSAGGRKAGGLTNAVLRAFLADRGERTPRPSDVDRRRWLSVADAQGYRFETPIWPDPALAPAQFLSRTTSHPLWLVMRWLDCFGPATERICETGQRRPPIVIRPNRLRIDPPQLLERLIARGMSARLDAATGAIELTAGAAVREWPEFKEGLFQLQDRTAQAVWLAHPPRPGEFVVDLCAGLGTKATQAAEWMSDRGVVLASDIDSAKLAALEANAARLGLTCVRAVPPSALEAEIARQGRPPDVILVDAPCSATGVLARRPEARYRLNDARLRALANLQGKLLRQAVALCGPSTQVLYSTCSIEQEENEARIESFCSQHPGWHVRSAECAIPDAGGGETPWRDGGYWALLGRD